MLKRVHVTLLVVSLVSPKLALAQRLDLEKATGEALKATVSAEVQRQRPAARGENPYMLPGLALLGGGAALTVLGFLDKTGFECSGDFLEKCGLQSNKGLVFAGLAVAGVGAALIVVGEGKRGVPSISPRARGFLVEERLRF